MPIRWEGDEVGQWEAKDGTAPEPEPRASPSA